MLNEGSKATLKKTFASEDVHSFAVLSGDLNPIHSEGSDNVFGQPVVHGMHLSALIGAILGTKTPGPGTILLKQSIEYVSPAFVGDEITAEVEVLTINRKGAATMRTTCVNQDGQTVLDGVAHVLVPRHLVRELSH